MHACMNLRVTLKSALLAKPWSTNAKVVSPESLIPECTKCVKLSLAEAACITDRTLNFHVCTGGAVVL